MGRLPPQRRFRQLLPVVLIAFAALACGDDDSGTGSTGSSTAPTIAVFTAFPAELTALLTPRRGAPITTVVDHTVRVNDHVFRVGTINGTPVILGQTGIGLLNAAATASAVLDMFAVDGVVFSGVAGSTQRIGDVVAAQRWELSDGSGYDADPAYLALTRRIARREHLPFEQCTEIPDQPERQVCIGRQPALIVEGIGRSSDMFFAPFPCFCGRGDVYGCDPEEICPTSALSSGFVGRDVTTSGMPVDAPITVDEETAAVAREAAARALPFIGFRGVSDGAGDPLNLPSDDFEQFNVYYRLAARNAALAASALLEHLSHGG